MRGETRWTGLRGGADGPRDGHRECHRAPIALPARIMRIDAHQPCQEQSYAHSGCDLQFRGPAAASTLAKAAGRARRCSSQARERTQQAEHLSGENPASGLDRRSLSKRLGQLQRLVRVKDQAGSAHTKTTFPIASGPSREVHHSRPRFRPMERVPWSIGRFPPGLAGRATAGEAILPTSRCCRPAAPREALAIHTLHLHRTRQFAPVGFRFCRPVRA